MSETERIKQGLNELVNAIDKKWTHRKSTPPKELIDPLINAKLVLHETN